MDLDAATNLVMDKLERGQHISKAELIAAKMCVECEGTGEVYDDERDRDARCWVCGGDGLAKDNPTKGR